MNKNFWIIVFVLLIIAAISLSSKSQLETSKYATLSKLRGDVYILVALIIIVLIVISILCGRIHEKYLEDDPILVQIKQKLKTCFPEINSTILLKGKKSYTINKKRIHICLKDEKGDYYDQNMLIYVTIHELAHVKCPEVGHTDLFYTIFNELLDRGAACGVYDKGKPLIKDYCEYSKED